MRFWMVLTLFGCIVAAGCDRLPARGGLGEPCFGDGHCAESDLICIPGEEVCCRPDCENRCDGAPNGCAGTCDDPCPGGMWCADQACVACADHEHCGPGCSDCTAQNSDRACVALDGEFRCGCVAGSDCASDDCGADGRCVICTPECTGAFCGADDGCGGVCIVDSCEMGEFCQGDTAPPCQACAVDAHCGIDCLDCADGSRGAACLDLDSPGLYYCGCSTYEDCQPGQSCDSALHQCFGDTCCGSDCEDCSQQSSNKVCLVPAAMAEYQCGCEGDGDCDQNTGETCLASVCVPSGMACEDDHDCFGTDCTLNDTDKVCVDISGFGDCQCGCDQDGDCADGELCSGFQSCESDGSCAVDADCDQLTEVCYHGSCCQLDCLPGNCGTDDGCGGTCGCDPGTYCNNGNCQICNVDQACGETCDDCAGAVAGHRCVDSGGTYRCACNGDGDCLSGTCPVDRCSNMSLLYDFDVAAHGCVVVADLALAALPAEMGGDTLAVACGGGSGERPVLIFRLDGVLGDPDFVLTASGVHTTDLRAVSIAGTSGDVYSADADGHWFRWAWNGTSGSFEPPADMETATLGTPAYFLRSSGDPLRIVVFTTPSGSQLTVFDSASALIDEAGLGALSTSLAFAPDASKLLMGTETALDTDDGVIVRDVVGKSTSTFGPSLEVHQLVSASADNGYALAAYGVDNDDGAHKVVFFSDLSGTESTDCARWDMGEDISFSMASTIDDTVVWLGQASGQMRAYNPLNDRDSGLFEAHPNCSQSVSSMATIDGKMATACRAKVRIWAPAVLAVEEGVDTP